MFEMLFINVNVRLRPMILINWLVNVARNVKHVSNIVWFSITTVLSTVGRLSTG